MAMHDEARKKMAREDVDLIAQYTDGWNKAYAAGDKAGMDRYHQLAEGVRGKYNYTGGEDGSLYQAVGKSPTGGWSSQSSYSQTVRTTPKNAGTFSYPSMSQFTDKYQALIDAAQGKVLNRAAFEYDPEKDAAYKQYEASYTRQGNKAMQDTLAEISARTGGLASSYAGQAAQQTYDGYMSALADKIPELREIAYQKYMDEYNMDRDALNVLTGLSDREYGRYLDDRNQHNTDRNFAYGQFADDRDYAYKLGRDKISDERYENEWAYKQEQDAYNRAWDEDEREYQRGQDAYNREWNENERDYVRQQDALDREEAARRVSSGGGTAVGMDAKTSSVLAEMLNIYETQGEAAAREYGRKNAENQWSYNALLENFELEVNGGKKRVVMADDALLTQMQGYLDAGKSGTWVVDKLWNSPDVDNYTLEQYISLLGLEDAEEDYIRRFNPDGKVQVGGGGGASKKNTDHKM